MAKNPNAVALGRLGGLKRRDVLSPERRKEISLIAVAARMKSGCNGASCQLATNPTPRMSMHRTAIENFCNAIGIVTEIKAEIGFPFDVLANGARCDIKTATQRNGSWSFNIHQHGKLEHRCDFYCLAMPENTWLIVPAENIKTKTFSVSVKKLPSLLALYGTFSPILNFSETKAN